MEEIIYLNGKLIPRSQAKLSPFDHGFLYGYGLFETMRSYGGSIFRLDRHLARLHHAAEALGIASRLTTFDLEKACREVLRANNLVEARIRLTVSAGEGDITPNPAACGSITVFIVARRLVSLPPESYERGYAAALSSWRLNSQSPILMLKYTCYLENVLARQEAVTAGVDEALLLNERGFVAEGSSANIFAAGAGMLITPSIESGALPGITREAVLELAQSMGIMPVVRQVEQGELLKADEAFLTNSILEIMPLTRLDGKPIGSGRPGLLTQRLMSAYKKLVAKET
ncbi:MAG: aminotransferase class IV [Dehalococcoidia bacterium]|nr:aminotransferase class IV [Dehalococcoidia bacterium]